MRQHRQWEKAFVKTIEYYRELLSTDGTRPEADYFGIRRAERFNPRIVKAGLCDFICDVEITAMRVLSPFDLECFRLSYVNPEPDDKLVDSVRQRIEEKMGKAFIGRGIFPMKKYFEARHV